MIYRRGNIYWAKFKRNRKTICKSLKTEDYEKAITREASLKAEYEQVRRVGLLDVETAALTTKSIDELRLIAQKMLAGMRYRSRKKSIPCTLDKDQIIFLLTASCGECAVTGVPLDMDTKVLGGRVSPWMPSIDRIDSKKGYTKNNCRIVCYQANLAMSQFGEGALELLLHHYALKKFKKAG